MEPDRNYDSDGDVIMVDIIKPEDMFTLIAVRTFEEQINCILKTFKKKVVYVKHH